MAVISSKYANVLSSTVSQLPVRYVLQYSVDWLLAIVLALFGKFLEFNVEPFHRNFNIMDTSIGFPFTQSEQVSDLMLYIFSIVVPLAVILLMTLGTSLFDIVQSRRQNRESDAHKHTQKIHMLHISILVLTMSLALTGTITEFLKIMIGKPRPDFLVRCKPKQGTPISGTVGIGVCTAPLGKSVLRDGFKSCPSGHASISFCGLGFLTLWLLGQSGAFHFKKNTKHTPIYMRIVPLLPVVFASWIALTRTQDYRHDFRDIGFGSFIGLSCAIATYFAFFNDKNGLDPGILNRTATTTKTNPRALDSIPSKPKGYDIV